MFTFSLPYPPSVNDYYGRAAKHVYLKAAGRAYRRAVKEAMLCLDHAALAPYVAARLAVRVILNPCLENTEQQRPDADNGNKALLDALTHAGLWRDDKQIDALLNIRGEPVARGSVTVTVARMDSVCIHFEAAA